MEILEETLTMLVFVSFLILHIWKPKGNIQVTDQGTEMKV